jgi:hypothetical protein
MWRIRRWLWNGATALSLLLSAITLTLWIRSYWIGCSADLMNWHRTGVVLTADPGVVEVTVQRTDQPEGKTAILTTEWRYKKAGIFSGEYLALPKKSWLIFGIRHLSDRDPDHPWPPRVLRDSLIGFRHSTRYETQNGRTISWSEFISMPFWSICFAFALFPTFRLWRYAPSRKRNKSGHCPICGYDLRATPDRCPECGTLTHS